jgi:hypothetical protein
MIKCLGWEICSLEREFPLVMTGRRFPWVPVATSLQPAYINIQIPHYFFRPEDGGSSSEDHTLESDYRKLSNTASGQRNQK